MHIRRLLGLALALALCFCRRPGRSRSAATRIRIRRDAAPAARPGYGRARAVGGRRHRRRADRSSRRHDERRHSAQVGVRALHQGSERRLHSFYAQRSIPRRSRTSDVSIYIRAVEKNQLAAVVAALRRRPRRPRAASRSRHRQRPKYPWDNVHFLQKPADGRITRAIALPPGDYELFVAVKERSASPTAAAVESARVRRRQNRPASSCRPGCRTSTSRSCRRAASSSRPRSNRSAASCRRPSRKRIRTSSVRCASCRRRDGRFGKNNELQVIFWVYGAAAAAGGKPDVTDGVQLPSQAAGRHGEVLQQDGAAGAQRADAAARVQRRGGPSAAGQPGRGTGAVSRRATIGSKSRSRTSRLVR